MGRGLLGLIQLGMTLLFAIPIGLLGIKFLFTNDVVVGVAFLGIAALMVLLEEIATKPTDLLTSPFERAVETVVITDDEE